MYMETFEYIDVYICANGDALSRFKLFFSGTHFPSLSNLLLLSSPKTTHKTHFYSLASDSELHIVSPVPFSTTTVQF